MHKSGIQPYSLIAIQNTLVMIPYRSTESYENDNLADIFQENDSLLLSQKPKFSDSSGGHIQYVGAT